MENTDKPTGAFYETLIRSNSKIRNDRAIAILEQAELMYKRQIEDFEVEYKKLNRERQNMLDLSPTNADSLVLASDFDAARFVAKDIELGVKLQNLTIKMNIARESYNVPAQPPVVAVLTPQISEENHPATAGCAAAPCSAGDDAVSKEVLRENVSCLLDIILESNKTWRENDSKKKWELNGVY